MGLITNLIGNYGRAKEEESRQRTAQIQQQIGGFQAILSNPDATPQARQAAAANITGLLTKHGGPEAKKHVPFFGTMLGTLAGLAGMPREQKAAAPAVEMPSQVLMSEEEKAAQRKKQFGEKLGEEEQLADVRGSRTLKTYKEEKAIDRESRTAEQKDAVQYIDDHREALKKAGMSDEDIEQMKLEAVAPTGVKFHAPKPMMLAIKDKRTGEVTNVWAAPGSIDTTLYEVVGKTGTARAPGDNMSGELRTLAQAYMAQGRTMNEAKALAGRDYLRKYGTAQNIKELELKINQELAGIDETPQTPATPPATPPTAQTTPQTQPAIVAYGKPVPGLGPEPILETPQTPMPPKGTPSDVPPPAKPQATPPAPGPVPAKGTPVLSDRDTQSMNEAIDRMLGLTPGGGRDKYSNLRVKRGKEILRQQTGMTETQLYAAVQMKKADAKALSTTTQRLSGAEGLQRSLREHGKLLREARSKVDDKGVPLINKYLQASARQIASDPELGRLDLAINAVSREYARLVGGGFTSNAMPHVSSQEEAKHIFASSMTEENIAGKLDQLDKEAVAERKAMTDQQRELFDRIAAPLGETRPGGSADKDTPKGGGGAMPKTADDFWKKVGK
jgi:hypothetical protein